jgi:ankyrin repeat protein
MSSVVKCESFSDIGFIGIHELDMIILLLLPNKDLGAALCCNKNISNLGNYPELWMHKLGKLLDYKFWPNNEYNYKELYRQLYNTSTLGVKLIVAAQYGHLEIMKILIAKGADLRAFGEEEQRIAWNHDHFDLSHNQEEVSIALIIAAIYGQTMVIEYFMPKKTNGVEYAFNYSSFLVDYLLEVAADNGHISLVKYLVELDPPYAISTAIDSAAYFGYLEMLQYLVDRTNPAPVVMSSALTYAIDRGHVNLEKYIICKMCAADTTISIKGADINNIPNK